MTTPLARASAGLDRCVHCGFCLPACPTYVALEDENDSPRGRLVLMRRLLDGELDAHDPDLGAHLDRCLGCRACEPACPSGVPYGELLEATRATLREARPLPPVARVILATFAHPFTLAMALRLARLLRATRLPHLAARLLPRRLAFPAAMLAASAPTRVARGSPALPAAGRTTGPTLLFDGCVMPGLFPHVQRAGAHALEADGARVARLGTWRCCGALHAHAGDMEGARTLARRVVAEAERTPDAPIACTSAGCGAMLKQYGHLLADDDAWRERAESVAARVSDVTELLDARRGVDANTDANAGTTSDSRDAPRITYSPPCHLLHAQRVAIPPEALLDTTGLARVPLRDASHCCGSAGIYNLLEPDTSDAVLANKLAAIRESGADVVATGNPGCMMQIGAGLLLEGSRTRVVHPVELLARD